MLPGQDEFSIRVTGFKGFQVGVTDDLGEVRGDKTTRCTWNNQKVFIFNLEVQIWAEGVEVGIQNIKTILCTWHIKSDIDV